MACEMSMRGVIGKHLSVELSSKLLKGGRDPRDLTAKDLGPEVYKRCEVTPEDSWEGVGGRGRL